ncbi:MAG: hypothetical protein ACSHWZ_01610 [Sulfitobacter sp.]
MNNPQLQKALRQLGLALLNATLMLCLALLIAGFLLLGRMQDLAQGTRAAAAEALAPQTARLERMTAALEGIEAQVTTGAVAPEMQTQLSSLRVEIAQVRDDFQRAQQMDSQEAGDRMVKAVATWLATLVPSKG